MLHTLISFTYPHEAHIAQSYLESEGIRVILKDELTVQTNHFYSPAIGGVKLQVLEQDIERGVELLKEGGFVKVRDNRKKKETPTVYVNYKDDLSYCPFCSSENIAVKSSPRPLVLLFYLFLGALLPIFKRTNFCYDCEKEWRFVLKTNNERHS